MKITRLNSITKQMFSLDSFKLIQEKNFSESQIQLKVYQHEKLKCNYYHFGSDDKNKAFAILLKTLPKNNKGLPHILEHTALCGSKKYPVRDPFFNMLNRSLNTYMNAWTGSDFTMYPFSS